MDALGKNPSRNFFDFKNTATTMTSPKDSVGVSQKVIIAAKWGAGGTILRIAIQFVAQVALVRLLSPETFGLYAVGAIILGVSAFLVDMGIGPALVQKETITELDIRFAFTTQVIIGVALSSLLFFSAPSIASMMRQPAATDVVRVLSLVCLINAVSAVSQNLLRRHLNFKTIHVAQVVSFAMGYFVIGIPAAFLGAGVWAIVAAVLSQNVIASVWMLIVSKHPKRPLLMYREGGPALLRFGLQAVGTNLLNWALTNIDRILVGRAFPGFGLGVYNTTYNLILAPTGQAMGILQSVLFPASARSQQDRKLLLRICRGNLNVAALIVIPIFGAIALLSQPIIHLLYGDKWSSAAPVLSALALAMIPYCLMGTLTPVLWGIGKVQLEARVQIASLILLISGALIASKFSYEDVAWVVAGTFLFRFLALVVVFAREFQAGVFDLMRELLGGVALGLAGGMVASAVIHLFLGSEANAGTRLLTGAGGFGMAAIAALPALGALLSPNGSTLVLRLLQRTNSRPAVWLRKMVTSKAQDAA